MNLIIDVGNHKTLLGYFDHDQLIKVEKVPTPYSLDKLLTDIATIVINSSMVFDKAMIGIETKHNLVYLKNRLQGSDFQLLSKLEKKISIPFQLLDNLVLASKYELSQLSNDQKLTILYLSIGHQLKYSLINNHNFHNQSIIQANLKPELISGQAFLAKHHQLAKNTNSAEIWSSYANNLAQFLWPLHNQFELNQIILGSAMAKYFHQYENTLNHYLQLLVLPIHHLPAISASQQPIYNVLYGGNQILNEN